MRWCQASFPSLAHSLCVSPSLTLARSHTLRWLPKPPSVLGLAKVLRDKIFVFLYLVFFCSLSPTVLLAFVSAPLCSSTPIAFRFVYLRFDFLSSFFFVPSSPFFFHLFFIIVRPLYAYVCHSPQLDNCPHRLLSASLSDTEKNNTHTVFSPVSVFFILDSLTTVSPPSLSHV